MRSRWLESRLTPWIAGVVLALLLCSPYGFMALFRSVWQTHYPQLASQWGNDGRFSVIGWFGTEVNYEELGYADRVNDAAHHWLAYDPFIKENRTPRQFLINKVDYELMGAIQYLTKNVSTTWILTRFLCCVAWFLLIYFLALRATASPPASFFAAVFVTGFSYLLTLLFLYNLSWSASPSALFHNAWSVLSYGRTEGVLRLPRAGLTYGFLFLASAALVKAAETGRRRWLFAAGAGGLLAYVHVDVWMSYMAASGLLAFVYWFKDRRLAWRLLGAWALACLFSAPFLATNFPPNKELAYRALFGAGVPPSFSWYSLLFWPPALLTLRAKRQPIDMVLACLAISSFLMMNAGFLVGYSFDPGRWISIGNVFVFLTVLSFLPARWLSRQGPWIAASAFLAGVVFLQGVCYAAIHFPFEGLPKDYAEALSWLDARTPKDSSVLSLNAEVNALIPAFTHDKVELAFVPPVFSDYPLLANYERLLGALKLLGADPKRFVDDMLLAPDPNDRRSVLDTGLRRGSIERGQLLIYAFNITPAWYRAGIIEQAHGRAAEVKPDYVWSGVVERAWAGKNFPGSWKPVYRNPTVTIYAPMDR